MSRSSALMRSGWMFWQVSFRGTMYIAVAFPASWRWGRWGTSRRSIGRMIRRNGRRTIGQMPLLYTTSGRKPGGYAQMHFSVSRGQGRRTLCPGGVQGPLGTMTLPIAHARKTLPSGVRGIGGPWWCISRIAGMPHRTMASRISKATVSEGHAAMLAFTLRRRQLEHPLLLPATLTMSSYAGSRVAGFIQTKAGLNADWQSFCVVNGSITLGGVERECPAGAWSQVMTACFVHGFRS